MCSIQRGDTVKRIYGKVLNLEWKRKGVMHSESNDDDDHKLV